MKNTFSKNQDNQGFKQNIGDDWGRRKRIFEREK